MRICIAGGKGFIGHEMVEFFRKEDFEISVLNRNDFAEGQLARKLAGCEVIINMTGESVIGIWTGRKRRRIYNSRILTTRQLVEYVNREESQVKVFINVSGISLYDHEHVHDEGSSGILNDFLSRVITDWENELKGIKREGVRVVIMRLGVVLGRGGMMKVVIKPFKYGLGFTINSSEHMPYIHIQDLLRITGEIIANNDFRDVINVVAPGEISIRDFYKALGRAVKRRVWIKIPPGLLKIFMGESAVLLIRGQHVIPKKLIASGYSFLFGDAEKALESIAEVIFI